MPLKKIQETVPFVRGTGQRNFLIISTIAVSGTGFYTITLIQQHEEDLAFVQMVGTQESVFRRLGNAFLAKPKT